jgi:hypothetical protein
MRRREKFVIASATLSLGLLGVQSIDLDYRYLAAGVFSLGAYLVATWALKDDLQLHERLTVVPLPALYAASVALFYFLLPENFLSKVGILILFGVGMYGLFLTANIFSVAKGRTIQLLHAAHAVGLLFTMLTSLLFANTIFSLKLPFFLNSLLVGLVHFPLIFMSLWSVKLEGEVNARIGSLSIVLTIILMELALILSFYPLSVWYNALFIMALLYIGLGVLHNYLKGRLFSRTLNEYALLAVFLFAIFLLVFPFK